jgi:hypothetical protein
VSNNVAEFTAFAAACQWVAESDLASATVLGDSELVADTFHGRKTLRLPALRHLMVVAKACLAQAGPVCVEHAPRRDNERADALLLDDSLGTAISRPNTRTGQPRAFASAGAAAFVVVSLKVALGYFMHPRKF